jgi:type II secretory pathway pseudopilin PulG
MQEQQQQQQQQQQERQQQQQQERQQQQQQQQQIRGSLHCAAHDETVSSFGRDDDLFMVVNRYLWSLVSQGYGRYESGLWSR